jgi:hypothetical protein
MLIVVDQLDHVEATVDVLLGDVPSARALLAGLVEQNEAGGRRRLADRYRRDLVALDPAGPD